ncbi:MAG TPA: hypothetical protein VFI30_06590, partial [Nocardioidaceae bacterium]|nr:hypothetical protein [Nocardioidaceae bacterium]
MAWAVRRVLKSGEVRYLARYRDASGRCHSAGTAPTQKIALALAREQESRIFRGDWQDPALARTTLAEYFSVRWLPNRILELNTCKTYLAHWRTAIAPEFGNRAMRTITPGQVQEWVTRMQRQGASRVTIRDRFRVLQAILAAQHGVS